MDAHRSMGFVKLATATGLALALACSPATDPPERTWIENPSAEDSEEHLFGAADLQNRFAAVDGYAQSDVLPAEHGATRAGFLLDKLEGLAQSALDVQVRGVFADGTSTPWLNAEVTWQEGAHVVARADFGQIVAATQLRIRLDQIAQVAQLTYAASIPEQLEPAAGDQTLGESAQALESDLIDFVKPRSAWQARATKCSGSDSNKYRMAIHHTETPPSSSGGYAARLRAIQAYHMDTRGWCDIGYHFLITEDGQIWEGRPIKYRGAHVANNNTGNIGISWVGCYHPGACASITTNDEPSQTILDAGSSLIAKLAKSYGIAIESSNIKPHRAHPGASTDCPGDNLAAKIPSMLAAAANPPPPPSTGDKGRVVGVVWDLATGSSPSASSAKRITNATVSVAGGPSTSVRATDAFWELELAAGNATLGAEAPGYTPAQKTVSVAANATTWASLGLAPSTTVSSFGQTENNWSCAGTAGTYKNAAGKYYVTSFGCWVDSSGVKHADSGDNCIPWCLGNAATQGRKPQYDALCAGLSGPDCERKVNWYTAGADRFGCGARIKVTNPATGKSAVLAVLDRGPACWVEDKVDHWVLDMSYPASYHLFGEAKAVTEKGLVVVQEVSDSTPLGPL